MSTTTYTLLDSGEGRKLERFGEYVLSRPCSQAVWRPQLPQSAWEAADAIFSRDQENKWTTKRTLPEEWRVEAAGITFKIAPTDFGHLGLFPEQKTFWEWIYNTLRPYATSTFRPRLLNLFAYSGGVTLAAAKAGASVCHLDASKGMVTWARENAAINHLEEAPIRWIVEDVKKFLIREQRRGSRYDAIVLDPPSFGRGAKGEVFKIEEDIIPLLKDCRSLLSENPIFFLFSCHTPGFTPVALKNLMEQLFHGCAGELDTGEMTLKGAHSVFELPSGTFARWRFK